ncbi:hypothetical protein [Asanoa siamensis]|uniref:hypothetical protein n=1 Tax=Asanoa siamensis TaxID=926357 RepID=UPI001943DF00|nr:hypothetical protein [Asanoa siamensis]
MDGRRGYPDDEQQQRWSDDDRGFGEETWRGGTERAAEPSFNGFAGGFEREPRWPDSGQDQPSWNTSARPLPADGVRRQIDDPPQRGYGAEPAGPATGELPRPAQAEVRLPLGEPVPAPLPLPDPMPPTPGPDPANLNMPTGLMPPITPREDPMRRPASAPPASDGVYRTRRPALALVYGVVTAIFEIGALRIFFDSMFGGDLVISGIVSGMMLIAGLPMLAAGLYSASTGGARVDGPGAWLRPPALYLVVGLGLLIAGGVAAG